MRVIASLALAAVLIYLTACLLEWVRYRTTRIDINRNYQ